MPMGGLGGDQLESAGQAEGSSHSGGRLGRFAADGVTFPQAKGFLDRERHSGYRLYCCIRETQP